MPTPPRPRLATHREPSAPELAGLFPANDTLPELGRASRAQAAFLWHYAGELDKRMTAIEEVVARIEAAQHAEAERNEKFRSDLASKELACERREAEKGSVRFWFSWLLPAVAGIVGAVGKMLFDRIFSK